ncbi:MAG: hypothetical protein PHE06_06440 [Lachnospiraceae bacterium]|nr:hypothetical protein [Lachnospiraceae bacterium]
MSKKERIILGVLIAVMSIKSVVLASEVKEVLPSSISGYYYSDQYSLVFMDNGMVYALDPETESNRSTSEKYQVSSDGSHYFVEVSDSMICLVEQTEKEPIEDGGIYYAVYLTYLGTEDEITFEEGKMVLFGGYVFDNDYEVIIREPLARFFTIDDVSGTARPGCTEGRGYQSPEDAVSAYLKGFQENDIDQMMAACAVETYVERFDLIKYVERLQAYSPSMTCLPDISGFSERLNLESRRAEIIKAIRQQYLTITKSSTAVGDSAGTVLPMKDFDTTTEEFLQNIFAEEDETFLSDIVFSGSFLKPEDLAEVYSSEQNQNNMGKTAAYLGAEEIQSVVAALTVKEDPYLLCMDTVCYDDKWYVLNAGGTIGSIEGISAYLGGVWPLTEEEAQELSNSFGIF